MNCKHRYEYCDDLCCVINCHDEPSKRGCPFVYYCNIDKKECDENCTDHVNNLAQIKLKVLRNYAYEAKMAIREINRILDMNIDGVHNYEDEKDE